jgi:malonyl-CoA O-methyltransferase
MRLPALELALPEESSSRRQFARAARSFASASFIHDEARRRLFDRLDGLKVAPGTIVDLGAALGQSAAELARRFPDASVVACDFSPEMLRRSVAGRFAKLAARAGQLPLPDRSVDLIFANLVLPWVRPDALFAEARRILQPNGLLVFSTLGPETLGELRQAWLRADDAIHVHAFFDGQILGDLILGAGLEEPVLDIDRLRVSYTELSAVIRDLRACGGTNTAAGRRRGLMGRRRWQRFVEALWRDQGEGREGRLSLTVELIFGQAFGSATDRQKRDHGEILIPVDRIGRRNDPDSA